ncbi:cyclodeaminase/cyclohydrolase family protein [Tissierella praeacuta]|uniref:cyclodeaminase/cyclohydrolase family protein n=1 Tax=Tissierella praeacuta TaxID=43131 RepID=UPI000ED31832|nr:cyclodeaminase/cyclohydrolase family protein [Tissierella praeacuta]MBU5257141.1 cyclodeaminase/cyclohydrolase family protein [Tissierella praeacuta]TCU66233.1 formimidoyltetrahydrofolate cyclodeaminase [Tissierella praeacuta]HAE92755.1 formimidoyltetrahydrofolate cyclodeaminase [Tissierella sp.]
MFINKSLKEYIAATASGEPTPGGGSVAALVGSLGGALTNMVNNLTVGKKAYEELSEEIKSKIANNSKEVEKLIEDLTGIVDEDTKAFDKVMEAFKLPKETDEEKIARTKAIQEGYKVALEVPLRCAEKCLRILELQDVFANYGNVNAITDVGVGTLLAYSGLEGALFNVTINLGSIKDEEFKKEVSAKVDNILKEGKKLKEELLNIVYKRLG